MTPQQEKLRAEAIAAALEYGYTIQPDGSMRACPGKFEGEPFFVLHYHQAVLDGDGESFGSDERVDCDVFELDDDERAAFELDATQSHMLVRHYESGHVGLEHLTQAQYEALQRVYAQDDEDDSNVYKLTAPSHWASYFINGDDSGLEPAEKAQADAWIEHVGMGDPVSCDDAGFIHSHDARVVGALAADCQTYTFLKSEG